MSYGVVLRGEKYTTAFRAYVTHEGEVISPFHDVPAYPDPTKPWIVNAINEIPRFSNAKLEINKEAKMNPIMQDVKNEVVRFVHNLYPFKGYMWNYGAIPQTWEDQDEEDPFAKIKIKGDNDPIDVIEIGARAKRPGQVYQAKILCCLGLVDDGECDWKVVVIDVADPMADKLDGKEDVERLMPNLLEDTREWFRNYKYPANGKRNNFAREEKYLDKDEAVEVVQSTHRSWERLIQRERYEGISLANRTVKGTPCHSEERVEPEGAEFKEGPLPEEAGTYFFMREN